MTPPQDQEPTPLDYQPGREQYRRGATLPVRLLAGAFCVAFAVWAWDIWRATGRGRFYLINAVQPSVLISGAGSVWCLLVALGVVGRRNSGNG